MACKRPSWAAFASVDSDGHLELPAHVRHALGLAAGGRVAFFENSDGQIEIWPIEKYRERFGNPLL